MTNNLELISRIFKKLSQLDYIRPEDVPNIELYMDQVTTFMDQHLEGSKRYEDDKILTKTMINNYAKNNLLPPPHKKKYSKEHMLLLIFIYYFKNILSISDIKELLNPITNNYFSGDSSVNLEEVYNQVCSLQEEQMEALTRDIKNKYKVSNKTFEHFPEKDQEYLRMFSFICTLAFDVYLKKHMIEMLIDEIKESQDEKGK